jgi:nucleoside-diphosphate-sugar epimerase
MRVLVTGASGFVGSALVPALAARGHEVRALRRGEDPPEGFEAAVHLANIAHGRASAESLQQVNVEGTRQLGEKAAARGVRRLVYLSSIKASGEQTAGRPFDGMEAPAPEDAYGRSKLAAERALAELGGRTKLEVVVLRPPLVYGARVRANFLALVDALSRGWPLPLASVRNARSLIYVGNLADAIARCIEVRQAAGRTYVVNDGAPRSTPELCRAIGAALGKPARLLPFPAALLRLAPPLRPLVRDLVIDDARLRVELGWRPPFSPEQGLRAMAEWYLAADQHYRGG